MMQKLAEAVVVLEVQAALGVASVIIGEVFGRIAERREKTMNGSNSWSNLKDHIVIFGWVPGSTDKVLEEIRTDPAYKLRDIVLCSDNLETSPAIMDIKFIKGKLSSKDVIDRSGVVNASKIIVYTQTDEQSVLVTLAVDASNRSSEVVVYIAEEENAEHIRRIDSIDRDGSISIITPPSVEMLVHEMQDPGVAEIIRRLLSSKADKTIFKMKTIHSYLYYDTLFKDSDSTVIGYELDGEFVIFPNKNQKSAKCSHIFYVSSSRVAIRE